MYHADERLIYKYVLIDVGTLNYVLNRFLIMLWSSVPSIRLYQYTVVFDVSQTETPKSWQEANAYRLYADWYTKRWLVHQTLIGTLLRHREDAKSETPRTRRQGQKTPSGKTPSCKTPLGKTPLRKTPQGKTLLSKTPLSAKQQDRGRRGEGGGEKKREGERRREREREKEGGRGSEGESCNGQCLGKCVHMYEVEVRIQIAHKRSQRTPFWQNAGCAPNF